MPIVTQGWAFVSGSEPAYGPSGSIQYNKSGDLTGSAGLVWDETQVLLTGSLSASNRITALEFYGDGANLTGLTASAVNVADGPEYAIQFRRDSPVSGEISGSADLIWVPASNTLSGTYAQFTAVTGSVLTASGNAYVGNNLFVSNNTSQLWGGVNLNSTGITATGPIAGATTVSGTHAQFTAVTASSIVGGSPITISASAITVSGDITTDYALSSSQNISAAAFIFGPGGRQQISDTSTDMSILAASTGMFISADGGNLTLQGQVAIDTAGVLSSSVNISASAFYGDGAALTGIAGFPFAGDAVITGSLYISSSNDDTQSLLQVDRKVGENPALFVSSSGQVGIGILNPSGTLHVNVSDLDAVADANYSDILVTKNSAAGISVLGSDGTSAAVLLGSPTDTSAAQWTYVPGANYSAFGHTRASGYVKLTSGDGAEALRLDANQHVTASGDITASGNISGSSFHGGTFYGSAAGLTNTTIPSNATDNQILIASSGFINANPANASLTSDQFDIGGSGFATAMTGALHVTGAGMVGNDSLFTVSGRDAGQIFEVTGSGGATVTGFLSASLNISASAFYGDGAGITGISLINLDAAGSDTNIQFNQNNEFGANAGLVYDGSGSLTVSGSYGVSEYIDPGLELEVTKSLGGKLTLGAWGNPYLQTLQYYATSSAGEPAEDEITIGPFNRLQIYQDGQISLSSSANADPDFEMPAGIELICNPGNGVVSIDTNRVSFVHNTASLSSEEQEYLWSINSDHAGDEDDSAWIKLDVDGKEFAVGAADSIKLVALGGLQVDNAASTFNSAATFNSSLVANGNVTLGDASGDGVTWNAGSWDMSANSVITTLKDGVDGLNGGNGALMFFTGSGGDFMKFHTSGSAKGIVFPQETYLSRAGALSGTVAGPGSFLAIDSDNKVVLATPAGGGGSIFTEINGTQAATTSSVSIGSSGTPAATLHVSSSGDAALFRVDGLTETAPPLFVTGSGRVGIGTQAPGATLDVLGDTLSDQLRLGHGGAFWYKMGRGGDGFLDFQGTQTNHTGYTFKNSSGTGVVRIEAENSRLAVTGSVLPGADNTHDLGSADKRWANVYTGDLHLANDRGDWTVVEEEDYLTIKNNKTGKRFKLLMEEIE